MRRKKTTFIVLLSMLSIFLLSSVPVSADSATSVTSKAGITFVDKNKPSKPEQSDEQTQQENKEDLPSTNEKKEKYLYFIGGGFILLAIVFYVRNRKKIQ
ncbi:TPA: LPXTG cell wall anchor domain-containing protein [Enterococcus faecalis]